MRRKVHFANAMTEADEVQPHRGLYKLHGEVDTFRRQATDAALSLYTISHACGYLPGAKEAQCDISNNLFALAAVLSCLSANIPPSIPSEIPHLDQEEVDLICKYIAACGPILDSIDIATKRADAYVRPGSTLRYEKGMHRLVFTVDEALKARHVLQTFCHVAARMAIKARNEFLGRRAEL